MGLLKKTLEILLLLLISCKNNAQPPSINEQNLLVKEGIENIINVTNPSLSKEVYFNFNKADSEITIEGFTNNKIKKIEYIKDYFNQENRLIDNYTLVYIKNSLSLILNQKVKNKNHKPFFIKKDTLYFKKNKLYFWKNKNPSKEEILSKEKEILTIKREIDSILDN